MTRSAESAEIYASLRRLEAWVEAQDFRGWNPYDALRSPVLRRLTFGSPAVGAAWVELVRRSPINLRPVLGVPRGQSPRGGALFLSAYLRRWRATGDAADRERVDAFADVLRSNAVDGYAGPCWSLPFDLPNRGLYLPAGTPTALDTALVALALLEAGDVVTARAACDFVLRDLPRDRGWGDEFAFSYTPVERRFIHVGNALCAELLARVGTRTGEDELVEGARAALRFTLRRQEGDGSWRHGPGPLDGWVDSIHTGMLLVALRRAGCLVGAEESGPAVARGYRYWKERFFLEDGAAKFYPDRLHPIDARSVAQAVLTFLEFRPIDARATDWAERVALWGIRHMQQPRGSFDYQIHRGYTLRTPYMRWSQAWMLRALRELAWVEAGRPGDEK